MIYTHVLNRGGKGVRSPADGLIGTMGSCQAYRCSTDLHLTAVRGPGAH
jgi:hypothetical protein